MRDYHEQYIIRSNRTKNSNILLMAELEKGLKSAEEGWISEEEMLDE